MSNHSGNIEEQTFTRIVNSQFFKTLVALIFFIASTTWYLGQIRAEILFSFVNLEHKIEIQNITMENRLKNLEEIQDRNFKYITDNYIKKTEWAKGNK